MLTKSQEDLIKYAAFNKELEKLAVPLMPLLSKLFGRIATKTPALKSIATNIGSKANKFISNYATKSHGTPFYRSSGSTFSALRAANSSKMRPMLGFGNKKILGYRQVTRTPFTKNPLKSTGEAVLSATANTMDNVKHFLKSPRKYVKEDLFRSQHFSKVVTGPGNKKYEIFAKRSIPGKIMNPVFDTGVGFGALTLATNKHDEKGQQQGILKRVGKAAGTSIAWGPLRPLTMAKFTAVDLPKEIKNSIKGF